MKPPAHKSGTAGQIVNVITLADYIKRKQEPQKLSFFAWWCKNHQHFYGQSIEAARQIWNAAQENM